MDNKIDYVKNKVGGPTKNYYIDELFKYATEIEPNSVIVDIGTCEGRTAFALALGSCCGTKIYTIDPTPNPRFYDHRKELGLEDRIEIITKPSQEVDWNLPIDLLFDDGLHTYEGVKADIEKFCPFVKKDHWVIFDDYSLYKNTVGKAIDEYQDKFYKFDHMYELIYYSKKI